MLSVAEALDLVLQECSPTEPTRTGLSDVTGMVLAEEVTSDVDSPPHDKSLVDGFAVRSSELSPGSELAVIEEVSAGEIPRLPIQTGQATRIMTGAPIPAGADAVVMVEQTLGLEDSSYSAKQIRVESPPREGFGILRQGMSMRQGQVVLAAGQTLRAVEIGLLAEVGRSNVRVHSRPRVAVLSTGNELVPVDSRPGPGAIRNSNGPMLCAFVEQQGATAVSLGIGRDDPAELRALIEQGLKHDILLLSGGVSAGKYDLVPKVLEELGVRQVFHRVQLKPGKPLWFGERSYESGKSLVFGLPGNPVSSFVCFRLFVCAAITSLLGLAWQSDGVRRAVLTNTFSHRGTRPTYHPATVTFDSDPPAVTTLSWQGSADLRTLTDANCLAIFPAGDRDYDEGDRLELIPF